MTDLTQARYEHEEVEDEEEEVDFYDEVQELLVENRWYDCVDKNPYLLLGFKLGADLEESEANAIGVLETLYEDCWYESENGDPQFNHEVYVMLLEMLFTRMYQDLNLVVNQSIPYALERSLDLPRPIIDPTFKKILFNVMFPLETSGYDYPAQPDKEPTDYTSVSDDGWRANQEYEYNAIIKEIGKLPEHWNVGLNGYLYRTLIFLYGDPTIEVEPEKTQPTQEEDEDVSLISLLP